MRGASANRKAWAADSAAIALLADVGGHRLARETAWMSNASEDAQPWALVAALALGQAVSTALQRRLMQREGRRQVAPAYAAASRAETRPKAGEPTSRLGARGLAIHPPGWEPTPRLLPRDQAPAEGCTAKPRKRRSLRQRRTAATCQVSRRMVGAQRSSTKIVGCCQSRLHSSSLRERSSFWAR
eukprot:1962094-Pleurochrysis_carterae.AAC.1